VNLFTDNETEGRDSDSRDPYFWVTCL